MKKGAILYVAIAGFIGLIAWAAGLTTYDALALTETIDKALFQGILAVAIGAQGLVICLLPFRNDKDGNAKTFDVVNNELQKHLKDHAETDKKNDDTLAKLNDDVADLKVAEKLTPNLDQLVEKHVAAHMAKRTSLELLFTRNYGSGITRNTGQEKPAAKPPKEASAPGRKKTQNNHKETGPAPGSADDTTTKEPELETSTAQEPPENPQENPIKDTFNIMLDALSNLDDPNVQDLKAHWTENMTKEQLAEWAKRNPLVKKLLENPAISAEITKLLGAKA